ncbi:CPBP family intramembrane glutamic endopeptidase [Litoreibacter arenae]|uniref:CAAX amino terminal protease family protein n=1 Tax=Litoreibacter arenae DSM 19593 TaxID=1123360 RepID=S9QDM0_9RHOB|nr:CPBP family intramembrane glutamic endopeptidase [Litoreibacter arenae]EPX77678.1 CAAX amino terminal protease family protein [Litoreibacter arenae DSM 19593]
MLRTPAFEAFIAPARRYPAFWRIVLATVTGFGIYMLGAGLVLWAGLTPLARIFPELEGMDPLMLLYGNGSSPGQMALILATFIPMGLAAFVMAAWHGRGPASLFGPRKGFARMFFMGVAVLAFANLVFFVTERLVAPEDYIPNLPFAIWATHLIWAVPLLFIQTTSEELVFRGYFQQQLAARFNHPFIWMVLPSLLFGLGHYDDTIDPILALMIVSATTLFGVLAADLTRVTGSLAAAMGLHFANNFVALLLVGIPRELSGLALYHAPFTMEDTSVLMAYVALDMIVLLLIWAGIRRALR